MYIFQYHMRKYNFLLVDDHPLFRKAVKAVLHDESFVNDVIELSNGARCIEMAIKHQIDVVLLDINMPEVDGIEAMRELRAKFDKIKVIVLTQFDEPKFSQTLIAMGANGYLLKSSTEEELIGAIKKILFDNQPVFNVEQDEILNPVNLSHRENEILILVCQEMNSESIAQRLSLSVHTVNNHRRNIMKKINTTTVAGMVHWAAKHNYF